MMDELEGRRFGILTVLGIPSNKYGRPRTMSRLCLCDCGKKRIITVRKLVNGLAKSCGCNRMAGAAKTAVSRTIHGMTHHPIYKAYRGMVDRCYRAKNHFYRYYGGRGITVCDEWKTDRIKFLSWALANGYADGLTLDRIDNDGNYEPSNCRWVTMKQQANNRSNNVFLTFRGETRSIAEWSTMMGLKPKTVAERLRKDWAVDEALTVPATHDAWKRGKRAHNNHPA